MTSYDTLCLDNSDIKCFVYLRKNYFDANISCLNEAGMWGWHLIFLYSNEQKWTIIDVIFIAHYITGATDIQCAFCKQLSL